MNEDLNNIIRKDKYIEMRKYYQKIFALFFVISSLILILTGCSKKEDSSNKISIVTSTNVYANIAQNVLGKYGKATAIITNSATDPHDFEPTTADAKKVQNAKIVVANGLGYDSWLPKLAKSTNKSAVLVGEDLMDLKNGANPHIWFDLKSGAAAIGTESRAFGVCAGRRLRAGGALSAYLRGRQSRKQELSATLSSIGAFRTLLPSNERLADFGGAG